MRKVWKGMIRRRNDETESASPGSRRRQEGPASSRSGKAIVKPIQLGWKTVRGASVVLPHNIPQALEEEGSVPNTGMLEMSGHLHDHNPLLLTSLSVVDTLFVITYVVIRSYSLEVTHVYHSDCAFISSYN